jgi:hypothetical protein
MTTDELHHLLEAWRDGSIFREDFTRLEAHLRESAEARRIWRRSANLDSALRDWASRDAGLGSWLPPQRSADAMRSRQWLWPVAAAFALLLGVAAYFLGGHRAARRTIAAAAPIEHTDLGCAVLSQTVNAQWGSSSANVHAGDTLNTGAISLHSGLAQIDFFSGASLIVEGPAELDLVSPWEAVCRQGKARVRVPPAAHGFRFTAPGMKLVDLGTEFAINVDPSQREPEVHVFNGEVIAHPEGAAELHLRQGQSLRGATLASLDPQAFLSHGQLDQLVAEQDAKRVADWWQWSLQARKDDRLLVYYPMRHASEWERLVNNVADNDDKSRNGGAVGAVWTRGRWAGKDALEFKRPGSRVRLKLDGTYDAITFACWARVDGIDRKYSALILTDGYDPGAPHWQIYEDGSLMFSISYPDADNPAVKRNQIYFSPPIFTVANSGRWQHLAVTYDNQSGMAIQYVNGREISRGVSQFHQPGRPIHFGPCELGNWGLPTPHHRFPIRNLNGSLDEFMIYKAALSADEIRQLYEVGKPD